jgi:hypothetical protein
MLLYNLRKNKMKLKLLMATAVVTLYSGDARSFVILDHEYHYHPASYV